MIIRIVRMYFDEQGSERFLTIFREHREAIRQVRGCRHLDLLQDINQPFVFVTLSHWDNEAALEAYRTSGLFKEVWGKVKVLFKESPKAFSLEKTDL